MICDLVAFLPPPAPAPRHKITKTISTMYLLLVKSLQIFKSSAFIHLIQPMPNK